MGTKKYYTQEERIQARRESKKRWNKNHADYMRNYNKNRNKNNPVDPEKRREYARNYYKAHPEKRKPYPKKKGWKCRKYENEEQRQMYQRADHLARNYKRLDSNKGFDISNNVDGDWIYENILTQKCIYCHREDWKMLGCDRIDNSKPHTPDNVVPCCKPCNDNRHQEEFLHYLLASYVMHFIQD